MPNKCTGIIALVFSVTLLATCSGSILNVCVDTSTNTGVAPQYKTTFAVATQVNAGTITSSPGPIPIAANAKCKPVVHEVTANA